MSVPLQATEPEKEHHFRREIAAVRAWDYPASWASMSIIFSLMGSESALTLACGATCNPLRGPVRASA